MARGELEPKNDHPARGSARPKLVLIHGGRDALVRDEFEGRHRGKVRRFVGDLWESMITFNSEYPCPHSWID